MRQRITQLLSGLLLGIALLGTDNASAQPDRPVSFQAFYDELSPYGDWIEDDNYGFVWVPNLEADFRPYYTHGHWVMTDLGNMWVSSYPWGWAPFHYGRWTYDIFYGWIWIPGYEWRPAWVCWRLGGGYYGWAPLGPSVTVIVNIGNYQCPHDWWIFVPHKHIYHRYFQIYAPRTSRNSVIINSTTIINNTYNDSRRKTTYVYGPRPDEYRIVSGKTARVHAVEDVGTPAQTSTGNNMVRIYRPEVNQRGERAVPQRSERAPWPVSEPGPVNANEGRVPEYRMTHPRQAIPEGRPVDRIRTEPARPRQQPSERKTTEPEQPRQRQAEIKPAEPRREQPPQGQPQNREPRIQPQRETRPVQRPEPQRTQPQDVPQQRVPQRTNPSEKQKIRN